MSRKVILNPTTGQLEVDSDLGSILGNPVTPSHGGTGTSTVFAQGSVVFAGASGVYAQDNANFFYDDTNNRLQLGGSIKWTGGAAVTAGEFSIGRDGSSFMAFNAPTGSQYDYYFNGVSVMSLSLNSDTNSRFSSYKDLYLLPGTSGGYNGYEVIVGDKSLVTAAGMSVLTSSASTGSAQFSFRVGAGLTIGTSLRSDYQYAQTLWAVNDTNGNQMIYCYSPYFTHDFDHALATDTEVYFQASVDPDVTNNLWGMLRHNRTVFQIITGAATGAGTVPVTVSNAITINPQGTEIARFTSSAAGIGVTSITAAKFQVLATATNFSVYAQSTYTGTSTDEFGNAQCANYGEYIATTTGYVIGQGGYAAGGNRSYGGMFRAIVNKNSATNIGVAGYALNGGTTPVQIGGYFALLNASPTLASAALLCDNGSQTDPILIAKDNGTTVFSILDSGFLSHDVTLTNATSAATLTYATSGTDANARSGFAITMNAGALGSGFSSAMSADNKIATTSASYLSDTSATGYCYRPNGNRGLSGYAHGSTTGHNIGGLYTAAGGAANYGLFATSTGTKAGAKNIGIFGNALNGGGGGEAHFGGLFMTMSSGAAPVWGTSAVLAADNVTDGITIFSGRSNNVEVFVLGANGNISAGPNAVSGGHNDFVFFPGAHTAVTSEKKGFYVRGATQTITGGFTNFRYSYFDSPTIDAASALTVTTASTVTINGAVIATGSAVITNPLALWVQSGNVNFDSNLGIGVLQPTARIHLAAGTATAGTGPLRFTLPGVPLTVPVTGVMETDNETLYYTNSSTVRGTVKVETQISSSAATLTLDKAYTRFIFTGGSATTWTCFALASNTGKGFTVHNRGSATITLNSSAGASDFSDLGVAVNTKSILAGETWHFYNDGTYFIIY